MSHSGLPREILQNFIERAYLAEYAKLLALWAK